jgi:sugar lactone lactonase YvrE
LAALAAGHPGLQVGLARALALNGDGAGAVAQLNRVADLGLSFGASNDAAFGSLKDDPDFVSAARRLAANGKGLGRGTAIIKLGLTGGSEGVAWSETSKSFLMGSSGAIHAYELDGQAPARPVAKAFGPQILGIRPDPASRSYLVCVNEHDGSSSAVVRHHESNGGIMAIHKLPTRNALCNDIALLRNGSFAVTDSNNGAVFHLLDGKLEPLALTTPIYLPNGIASDPDKNRLYVAHAGGVVVHDFGTGSSRELAADRTLIGALDGMVWHKGALIGVQSLANARMDSRLLRITPDADARAATVEVLLAGADFPGSSASTVAVVGDEAFVIGRTTTRDSNGERVEPFLIRAPL